MGQNDLVLLSRFESLMTTTKELDCEIVTCHQCVLMNYKTSDEITILSYFIDNDKQKSIVPVRAFPRHLFLIMVLSRL